MEAICLQLPELDNNSFKDDDCIDVMFVESLVHSSSPVTNSPLTKSELLL